MRFTLLLGLMLGVTVVLLPAQRATAPRAPGTRLVTKADCAATLGAGVKSRRTFCDVITAGTPAESVSLSIPAHTGVATLQFDLHNRFMIPVVANQPALAYTRHEAVVSVVSGSGDVIGQAAVVREFRVVADLFDQITGGGRPGGVKAVAPGPPEPVRFSIPAAVSSVGVVGASLRVKTALGVDEVFDSPGRPVAIVSNLRLEYRPR